MKDLSSRMAVIMITAVAISGLSGCATTSPQLEEAMSMARQAQSDAAAARDAASKAMRAATEAKKAATNAQNAAGAAQSSADQAGGCCAANSEKLERMFRESMRK